MPYIPQGEEGLNRERLEPRSTPATPGELNFAVTALAVAYMQEHGLNYQTINDIVGALECAKQEFYRRVASPYEDAKSLENGEVYPPC